MKTLSYGLGVALAIAISVALPVNAASGKEDDGVLTAPRLGGEYVVFRTGPPKQRTDQQERSYSDSALLGVLTGSILSPGDTLPVVEVQTEVSVVTSKEVLVGGRPRVEVEPMSDTGRRTVSIAEEEERKILERKAKAGKKKAPATNVAPVPALVLGAPEGVGKTVEVVPEAIKGVQSPRFEPKEGGIGVPPQKAIEGTTAGPEVQPLTTLAPPMAFRGDIVSVNLLTDQTVGSSSGGLFGGPFSSDRMALEPAASNQASRVNVKKGSDGEEFEYEYVYYYLDEDEEDGKGSKGAATPNIDDDFEKDEDNETPPKVPSTTSTTTSTTTTTTTTTTEAPTTEAQRSRVRGRGGSGQRSRFHVKNQHHEEDSGESSSDEEDSGEIVPDRGFGRQRGRGEGVSEGGRNRFRYTTIDRNRGASEAAEASVGNRIKPAVSETIEEAVPASNEVGVSRGGPRYRNRNRDQPAETIPEDRLPLNTRFPPRGATPAEDSSYATEPIQRVPVATPASPPRGAVRPSLELVDSSSFRTNAGGASPDQDLAAPSFPPIPSGAPVRFLGVNTEGGDEDEGGEEPSVGGSGRRNKPRLDAAPTTPTPTIAASIQPTYTHDIDDESVSSTLPAAVEKSVFDLYAILQAQDNGSNFVSTEEGEDSSSEGNTTPREEEETTTQEPTTTTTTTTTEPPTTTTTTTQAPPTERSNGRPNRFRGRGNNNQQPAPGRNRYRRPDSPATSTTTEAPSSEAPLRTRGRFNPNRNTGSRGSYGRRSTTTASPPQSDESANEEERPARPDRQFSRLPLNRTPGNRFRGRQQSSTTTESTLSEGEGPSSPSLLARPTFADRYNLRRRGQTTASPSAAEDNEEGGSERATGETSEVSPSPQSESPSRLPGRPRVRPPGSLSPRPLRPGPRINLPGRTRAGLAPLPQTSSTAAVEDPSDVAQEEAASETHSAAEEHVESEDGEDKPAVTTPIPGPLTRLRNRPRLRVTEKASTPRSAPASSAGRRQLVSSLLPRRRPGQASTAAPAASEENHEGEDHQEAEDHKEEASEGEDDAPPTTPATSTTAHQEERGLAGLLAGRKRARRPGTLFPGRPAPHANQDA